VAGRPAHLESAPSVAILSEKEAGGMRGASQAAPDYRSVVSTTTTTLKEVTS